MTTSGHGTAPADMYATLANQFAELSDQHAKLAGAYAKVKKDNDSMRLRLGENILSEDAFVDTIHHKRRRSNSGNVELQDLVLFQITFPHHIMKLISDLFGALDTQKQGFITEESFTAGHYQDFFQSFGAWSTLKQYFDSDGNNAIEPQEFVNGFALMAMNEVINVGCQVSVLEFEREMQTLIAAFAENKIYSCNALVRDHLGQSSIGLRRTPSSQMPSNLVYVCVLPNHVVLEMSRIFSSLQGQQVNGTRMITAQSMATSGLDVSKWQQLLTMFDEDASGTIDEFEFLNGFKKWVLIQSINLPNGQGTMKEILDLVANTANLKVQQSIAEFKQGLSAR